MQEVYVKSIMNIIENINYLGRRYKRIWHSALYRIRNPVVAIISVRFRSSPQITIKNIHYERTKS